MKQGDTELGEAQAFAREVERLRNAKVPGESGRLRELFDYLAARGPAGHSATQAEIAADVFGNDGVESDDATVRVYIHRLRKRLAEHYAGRAADGPQIVVPAGTYALRLEDGAAGAEVSGGEDAATPRPALTPVWLMTAAALLLIAGVFVGRLLAGGGTQAEANAIWQPFVESDRPIVVVVGDYYMFGEIDPVRPEQGRLIRDFSVNSESDLARAQGADPARYGNAEDFGLTYLPLSTAHALGALMPVLAQGGRDVQVIEASHFEPEMLRTSNIVYFGLISGMGALETLGFDGSGYAVGQSYDELRDTRSGRLYMSEEARRLAAPVSYRDYGYLSVFRTAANTRVAVVAGMRDTGLRAVAPLAAQAELPDRLADVAQHGGDFEALFEVTGQQGADLSDRLVEARAR